MLALVIAFDAGYWLVSAGSTGVLIRGSPPAACGEFQTTNWQSRIALDRKPTPTTERQQQRDIVESILEQGSS
jgi:hypothetical protein